MTSLPTSRPQLTPDLTEAEFLRWYWLKAELERFARDQQVSAAGNKATLTARIAAALGGRAFDKPRAVTKVRGPQLAGPITHETIIPAGQRSSQVVRAWMLEQVGAGFHFDAAMREFFAQSDGTRTMQDALDHYYATRNAVRSDIGEQFECNRFTRAWHEAHPDGTREQLLAEWRRYRDTPVDERAQIRVDVFADASIVADALAVMHRAFDQYAATGLPSGAMLETVASMEAELEEGMRLAVARVGERIVGVAKHKPAPDGTLYFRRLGVDPAMRGRGVARALVNALRAQAAREGLAGLTCAVRANEAGNIAMYERLGMEVADRATRVSYTGADIDVVLMRDVPRADVTPNGAV